MPSAILAPIAFAASIVTCFAPEDNCALLAIGAIDAAQREVLVNAYAFTVGSGIPGALVRAHDRGVDVRLIADKWTPCERGEGVDTLSAVGVPVWIDTRARIAHEKAIVSAEHRIVGILRELRYVLDRQIDGAVAQRDRRSPLLGGSPHRSRSRPHRSSVRGRPSQVSRVRHHWRLDTLLSDLGS